MEEDTAKLTHQFGNQKSKIKNQNDESYSLIDFNRSGVPLVEIVTEPDFDNAKEVKEYLQKLQQIVRYLKVSDADMEKGQMRLEPNISLREMSSQKSVDSKQLPSYKVEVKNINSFGFVEKAINYELKRQLEILNRGETPVQETRGWDEKQQKTVSQRIKEEANDYRYFPEPDIPPFKWKESEIDKLKEELPELPDDKVVRFKKQYSISVYDSEILSRDTNLANYFEEAVKVAQDIVTPKQIANYIINKKANIDEVLPAKFVEDILISLKTEKIDEDELKKVIHKVLSNNPKIREDYKKGKTNALQFAIGQVMYIVKKKIDTEKLKDLILEEIK